MRCFALFTLAASASLSAALVLPRGTGTQCAVCPKQIGSASDGTLVKYYSSSTQLGAPTFCIYGSNFSTFCWYGGDGGLMTAQSNALCPPRTTTEDCPPHSN